jgi:predicted CopG family antitoxin
METIEARIHITITEDAAKDEQKLKEQMRSLSNEIYKVCGVPPHVLVEVGNKPTQFTPAQVATEDVIRQIKEQMDREDAAQRRRQGR